VKGVKFVGDGYTHCEGTLQDSSFGNFFYYMLPEPSEL
jgi:hypothetical protein